MSSTGFHLQSRVVFCNDKNVIVDFNVTKQISAIHSIKRAEVSRVFRARALDVSIIQDFGVDGS